jgi:hypothetical protein
MNKNRLVVFSILGAVLFAPLVLYEAGKIWWNSTGEQRRPTFSYRSGSNNGFRAWDLPYFHTDIDGHGWVYDRQLRFGITVERQVKESLVMPGVQVTSNREKIMVYVPEPIRIDIKTGFIAIVSATRGVSYTQVDSKLHDELVQLQDQNEETIPIHLFERLELIQNKDRIIAPSEPRAKQLSE